MVTKTPDISEKIFEQIPSEKKMEIVRRISVHKRPVRSVKRCMLSSNINSLSSLDRKAPPRPDRPLLRKVSTIQPGTAPKTFMNVVRWFQENEAPKGVGKEKDGSISVWFHGERDDACMHVGLDPQAPSLSA